MSDKKQRFFTITGVDPRVQERAERNCLRRATTLRQVVERTIREQAALNVKDADAYMQEVDLLKEPWAPSRITLYTMRNSGELIDAANCEPGDVEKAHYLVAHGLIFYRYRKVKDYFRRKYPHIGKAKALRNEPITG